MCLRRPKADPRIAQEQARQRTDIEAAKQAARDKLSKEKADYLEGARAEANRIAAVEASARRTSEMEKVVIARQTAAASGKPPSATASMTASNLSAAATDSPETADVVKPDAPVKSSAAEREARIAKFGEVATAKRRVRRSGSRGRRSLITGLGGGIGYFNRFGG